MIYSRPQSKARTVMAGSMTIRISAKVIALTQPRKQSLDLYA